MKRLHFFAILSCFLFMTGCSSVKQSERNIASSGIVSISCKYSSIKRYDNTDYEPKIVAEVRDTFKVDNIMDAGPLAVVSKEIVNGKLNIYFTNKNMITEFQNKGRELISTKAKDSQHETQLFHSYYVKENGIAFVVTTSATCYFSELD